MDIISKSISVHALCLTGIAVLALFGGCSKTQPSEQEFREWLSAAYQRETGLTADKMIICVWNRTSPEILEEAPGVEGFQVEAMILSSVSNDVAEQSEVDTTIVHYVYCRYFNVPDEWYLHATSWGGGFWKQEPAEWGHLVQICRDHVEEFRKSGALRGQKEKR